MTVELHSAIADRLEAGQPFDDLVVEPRFLPTRYREAAALLSVDPTSRPERMDPVAAIQQNQALAVGGEPESGVSTAVLWILKHSFDSDSVHAPVTIAFENRFGRDQLEQAAARHLRSYGVDVRRTDLPLA